MSKLIILTGPSGAGKTTIGDALVAAGLVGRVVTHTTRPKRKGEVDGVDYHFIAPIEFTAMDKFGKFLEQAEVYGFKYGTTQHSIDNALSTKNDALIVCDVQGALWWQQHYEKEMQIIFISPPNLVALHNRLTRRGKDKFDVVVERLNTATREMGLAASFDSRIINNELQDAVMEVIEVIL